MKRDIFSKMKEMESPKYEAWVRSLLQIPFGVISPSPSDTVSATLAKARDDMNRAIHGHGIKLKSGNLTSQKASSAAKRIHTKCAGCSSQRRMENLVKLKGSRQNCGSPSRAICRSKNDTPYVEVWVYKGSTVV